MSGVELIGWDRLRHGGLLLDPPRLRRIAAHVPDPLSSFWEHQLRRLAAAVLDDSADVTEFMSFVLERICGFTGGNGTWQRGSQIGAEWGRRAVTRETVKPRQLWRGQNEAVLPVFFDPETRLGIGRGRKAASQTVQWLRAGSERLAVLTNGRQWRLIFAGLDFDAWCEWDVDLWFEEGALSPQVDALRTLLSPKLWTPPAKDAPSLLLEAILDSRKGQAELSAVLGERVREAVELLVQAHGEVLKEQCNGVEPADIYRAAVRVVMRIVVVLFAESRELLPRDNALYHGAYGLTGLLEELEKVSGRGGHRLARSWNAWPRMLALFRLVHQGSHHPTLPVPAYGGELFAPGDSTSLDGLTRALAVFENACFDRELLPDRDVHRMLEHITRTRVKVRQGRTSTWVPAPVDFSDLSSEYIGILYEGLLDFELKTAPAGDPVVFLAVGNQPALPLSRLDAMDDKALANLLEKMREEVGTRNEEEGATEEELDGEGSVEGEDAEVEEDENSDSPVNLIDTHSSYLVPTSFPDERHTTRTRAETWARRAVEVGKLARKPKGAMTPEKRLAYDEAVSRKARQLVIRVILPGEWYVVRWGGTRKGAGTFYTRPGLAVPTVQRTLRPLCYEEGGMRNEERGGRNEEREGGAESVGISGSGGLAESDGADRGNLPDRGRFAGTGALRAESAVEASSRVGSLEHCRGAQPPVDGGLSAPPPDGARVSGGTADSTPAGGAPGPACARNNGESDGAIRGMQPNASDPDFQVPLGPVPRSSFLIPRLPEEILAIKVCDPACGSGTFPVAALRFLTEALFVSVHHHGRVSADGERAIVRLLAGAPAQAGATEERLGHELLPCRPDDALFEPRLKAILRRHVVERSIYGVDLDPLAVELCRLALWIETMDRTLPFSFLDHKVKCGNALVGAWFDQFQHYPVMAFKSREGGDKGHSNGVHFQKDARGQALKAFVKDKLTPDLRVFLAGSTLFSEDLQEKAGTVHTDALATLSRLHDMPVHDSAERARVYREELVGSTAYRSLKSAMDLWCACWFWPADELRHAPLPTTLAAPPEESCALAERIATKKRFFHWELEFPDVFRAAGSGFDAILGNPPWETLQPNSKEFFSNIDPLYRSYGKQEALCCQTECFRNAEIERGWLEYAAGFANDSNWMKFAASPSGDPESAENNADRFTIARGNENATLHARWRSARAKSAGFASPEHPFCHRGEGKAYTYKLFLEQAHALLRSGGRLGFIVPSGLYSDHGTGGLRQLFLDRCRWEWLFGFENRDKVFEIDSRFKFNPVIIEKGGTTEAIRTVFMRRKLEDWERAEALATAYTRAQVERFSPRSKAILEIQSQRDLEILEKIYASSVLLGDDGPHGWGIKYAQGDFNMTSDSKLFPPRPKWEADGYRPDEYSRWLKGDWRPIAELWTELGVKPLPAGERRCAQPPYDTLPIPRADIPAGVILSREVDAWIREERVEDVALPLYEGRMVSLFDFSEKGWVSGKGRKAEWRVIPWESKQLDPQYLMAHGSYAGSESSGRPKLGFLAVGSGTNMRGMYCSVLPDLPCGNSVATLRADGGTQRLLGLLHRMASFVFDYVVRMRLTGVNLNYFVIDEAPLSEKSGSSPLIQVCTTSLSFPSQLFSPEWICITSGDPRTSPWRRWWAVTPHERVRKKAAVDAVAFAEASLNEDDGLHLLRDCDRLEPSSRSLDPKGFWRVDKDKDPELRHTVLTLVAFHELEEKIRACGGDREKGIEAFLNQNDGEGWMLPETLRLADYGLGHDERAEHPQPVASRLGPRFYDWQLAQTPEESWRECHLHARNLLGESGYHQLLADIEHQTSDTDGSQGTSRRGRSHCRNSVVRGQLTLEGLDEDGCP